ncbi:MAG TPA: 5-(carboxyamino)imidazole ribonucleotide mutase [Marinilabiliaceae bacterium]|nr:5-(carboxyamino)imidazole ribonucleotide mutase [Marinilabiliaceae bacterium]HBX87198.1 5-(carboxyamino)imidazole ribonucleotide mutase [Marinilabiliaceae bacterium]
MSKIVIIMGSKADLEWSARIAKAAESLGVATVMRIASAHKVPLKCLEIIKEYEKERAVFITVAGRSNALSGFSDAQTHCPVIACPPYGDKFAGTDIYSSLRMPSGVAPLVVLEPDNAALAAAKIIGLNDMNVRKKVMAFQEAQRQKLENDNNELL